MALSRRFVKRTVITAVALAVLVLNPVFGLLSGYDFGAPELRAAVEGTWQLTIASPDAPPRTVTFTLAQGAEAPDVHAARARSLVRPAAACGRRSLVKAASACRDSTELSLDVTTIADGKPQPRPGRGVFVVSGTRFHSGALRIDVGGVSLEATLTPTGEVVSASGYVPGERDTRTTTTRVRRPR
jgi:hypothetical protein